MQQAQISSVENASSIQPTGAQGKHGFLPSRLERFHESMKRHVDASHLPGLVALVNHKGREHAEVMGTMGYGRKEALKRDCIFRLASMTKPITAVAAMILLEECKIRLDDPVDEWLPELKNRRVLRKIDGPLDDTVPAKRSITVRDLLTFRSGYGEVGFIAPASPLQKALFENQMPLTVWPVVGTPDEFMKRLSNVPLAYQPGERWMYHLSGEILGVLISRVSGQSLGSFMRQRIFEPLEMKDTDFFVSETKVDRLPTCWGADLFTGELRILDEARGGWASKQPQFEGGAGGLMSTADDMMAFGLMLMNYGQYKSERILSRITIEAMTTDQLTLEQKQNSPFFENFWEAFGWGLGIGVITRRVGPEYVPGRFGWDGAFGSSFFVDPKEKLVGILMVQRSPDALAISPVVRDFWMSAYQLVED